MYQSNNAEEYVSVVGTEAFMDFVESIQSEGVELEKRAMGAGTKPVAPMIIEVDNKTAGTSKAIGMPIKFSKSKTEKSKGAPNLGEHTKEIMKIFDYNDEQIEDFYNRKVIL